QDQLAANGTGGDRVRHPQAVQARAENLRAIEQKSNEIAQDVVATERQRIDALGAGAAALERGVQWQAEYRRQLQPLESRAPALAGLMPYFTEKRLPALDAAQGELTRAAAGMTQNDELRQLQSRYLLEADSRTVPGAAILAAITQQARQIDKWTALGRAPDARQAATAAAPAPPGSDEPSEDVMYD